jgi:hypothetical protein
VSEVVVGTFPIPPRFNFEGVTSGELRRYYSREFLDSDGNVQMSSAFGSQEGFYESSAFTVSGGVATAAEFTTISTADAQDNAPSTILQSCEIVSSDGANLGTLYSGWQIPATTPTTFAALWNINRSKTYPIAPVTLVTLQQMIDYVQSVLGDRNYASSLILGNTYLDVDPASPTVPRAVGVNSLLLPSAGQLAALAGTSGTPSSLNKYVTDADPRLIGGVEWINVKSAPYGAIGNGVADDTAAFNAAVAAHNAAGGGVFYVPHGNYKTSGGFVFTAPTLLRGDSVVNEGSADYLSRVECTSSTAVLFTFTALNNHVEDVMLYNTAVLPSAGAGIKATHASANYARTTFSNVWVSSFYDDIYSEVNSNWTMQSVVILDPVRYGVYVNNIINTDTGDWSISASTFIASARNGDTAIYIAGSGGGRISDIKVNGGSSRFNYGIRAVPPSGVTGIIKISGNISIENVELIGISITGWNRVDVNDYQFGEYTAGKTSYALLFDTVTDSGYDNVRPYSAAGTGPPGVVLLNCARISKGTPHGYGVTPWLSVQGTYLETGYAINDGWTAVTFQNGWSNNGAGFADTKYALQNNLVNIKCAATGGTLNSVLFTLPVGFRPLENLYWPTFENGAAKFVLIGSDGTVTQVGASNVNVVFSAVFPPK